MSTEISMRAILEVARSRETVTKAKINREVKLTLSGGVENKENKHFFLLFNNIHEGSGAVETI